MTRSRCAGVGISWRMVQRGNVSVMVGSYESDEVNERNVEAAPPLLGFQKGAQAFALEPVVRPCAPAPYRCSKSAHIGRRVQASSRGVCAPAPLCAPIGGGRRESGSLVALNGPHPVEPAHGLPVGLALDGDALAEALAGGV